MRLWVWTIYPTQPANDTASYVELAEMIKTGDFEAYNGRRTPGYPVFLLALRYNPIFIRLFQIAFGLSVAVLLYRLARLHTTPAASLMLFFLLLCNMQATFYEALILTESFAAFLLAFSLFCFIQSGQSRLWVVLNGIVVAFSAWVRPHFIFLGFIYALLYCLQPRPTRSFAIQNALLFFFFFCIPILGWMTFNQIHLQRFTFTTLPKADIISHVILKIDDADPKYGITKEAFQRAYHERKNVVLERDDNRGFYFSHARSILRENGRELSPDLADEIHDMAMDLIRKHPGEYIWHAIKAFGRFWRVHIIMNWELFPSSRHAQFFRIFWSANKLVWIMANLLFFVSIPFVLFGKWTVAQRYLLFAIYLIVFGAAGSQAITQFYDNARFAVPFQPLVLLGAAILVPAMLQSINSIKTKLFNLGSDKGDPDESNITQTWPE